MVTSYIVVLELYAVQKSEFFPPLFNSGHGLMVGCSIRGTNADGRKDMKGRKVKK